MVRGFSIRPERDSTPLNYQNVESLSRMKTTDLPQSECVEDRRADKPTRKPQGKTLAEWLAWAEEKKRRYKPSPESTLARDAGVDDIGKKPNG